MGHHRTFAYAVFSRWLNGSLFHLLGIFAQILLSQGSLPWPLSLSLSPSQHFTPFPAFFLPIVSITL
jgi:hypothetical protein